MGERGHDWRWASKADPFAEPNVCARCGASANGLNNFGRCPGPSPRPTIKVMEGETTTLGERRERCPSEHTEEDLPGAWSTMQCVFDDGHAARHCFGDCRWGKAVDLSTTCPAPTPRAT